MSNQRRVIFTGITLFIIGFTAYLLMEERNRRKIMQMIKGFFNSSISYNRHNQELQTNIGHPDPQDERDNNMVWEGSLYAVKYYNKEEE